MQCAWRRKCSPKNANVPGADCMRDTLLLTAHALLATLALATTPGYAQNWKPERAIEIIVGTSPGGALDRTGRTLLRVIQERKLVDTATILNKPGGSGAVGLA